MENKKITEEEARKRLEGLYSEAEETLNNEDKLEKLFQRIEKKLRIVPLAGDKLAYIPMMASLIYSYTKKEYTDIPVGSVIAILAAVIYWVSPIDLLPDVIPALGYVDDALVVGICLDMVSSDLREYDKWRAENGKKYDIPDFEASANVRQFKTKKGK